MRFITQPIGRERRTQYARGADFERQTRDALMNGHDATYVVRSAGSRGIVDLVAFFPAEQIASKDDVGTLTFIASPVVWLVQCKRDGRLSAEDRELLCSLADEVGARPVLAYRYDNRPGVSFEQVSMNPNAEATEINRA